MVKINVLFFAYSCFDIVFRRDFGFLNVLYVYLKGWYGDSVV